MNKRRSMPRLLPVLTLASGLLWKVSPIHAEASDALALSAQANPNVHILTGDTSQTSSETNAKIKPLFKVTGTSPLKISKISVTMERDGKTYEAFLTTSDAFDDNEMHHLLVKVGDKILIPNEFGGDRQNHYTQIGLRSVNAASAQILNGAPFPRAPQESLQIEYTPDNTTKKPAGSHYVFIRIENVGKTPITFGWGTTGGQNYPCRDIQLAFTATCNGVSAPPNPKPLPAGFSSTPITLKPGDTLNRHEDITEWIQMDRPGQYLVAVSYFINIANSPDKGPTEWWVTYRDRFKMQVK